MKKIYLVTKDGFALHPCDTLETANRMLKYCLDESCGDLDDFECSRYSISTYYFFTMHDIEILEDSFGNKKTNNSIGKTYE